MESFDTKEMAEKALEELRREPQLAFCPLIKEICNPKCICFKDACIFIQYASRWDVYPTGCTNYMFTGER